MSDDDFTRRSVLRTGAAAVLGLGGVGTAPAAEAPGSDDTDEFEPVRRVPTLDVTDAAEGLETVAASNVVPERSSGIAPGSMLFITRADSSGTAGCTANFVWKGADGTLYLGAAGHCFLPDDADAGQNAGGSYDTSKVSVEACIDCTFGGTTALSGLRGRTVELGAVAYARRSQDGTGVGNDFGLVEIPSSVEDLVDPSMPTWGGPTTTGEINGGENVVQYGNGIAVGEVYPTKNRTGVGAFNDGEAGAWYAELPAAPGDSGSGVQVARQTATGPQGGEAAGILTHFTALSGTAGTNVAKAREMARQANLDVSVVFP